MVDALKSIEPKANVEVFQGYFNEFGHDPVFVDTLLQQMSDDNYQTACSWLLHQHLKVGQTVSDEQLGRLLSGLEALKHWVPILYHLQMLDYIQKPNEHGLWLMETFVRQQLESSNNYVKAWAYQSFSRLVDFEPGFKEELVLLCRENYMRATASAQARIRIIAKRFKFSLNSI